MFGDSRKNKVTVFFGGQPELVIVTTLPGE
jgi:hypothetical protein